MAKRVTCPHCRRALNLSGWQPGTRILCPSCCGKVEVPAVETAIRAREAKTAVVPVRPRGAAPRSAPPRRTAPQAPLTARHYGIFAGAVAGSLVLVCSVTAFGLVVFKRPAQGPVAVAPAPAAEACVELREFEDDPVHLPACLRGDEGTAAMGPPAPSMEYVPPPPITRDVKRRDRLSDEDLRKQLLSVRELRLHSSNDSRDFKKILDHAKNAKPNQHELNTLFARLDDLAGLPLRMGHDCQLGDEPAKNLQAFSRAVRGLLAAEKSQADEAMHAVRLQLFRDKLKELTGFHKIGEGKNVDFAEAAIPTLMQMLTPEKRGLRVVLVDHLSDISHRAASEALARLAVFDLSSEIRARALEALRDRPREQFRSVLVEALRYPWGPVADHAAEALVALKDKGAVPVLSRMVDLPSPTAPYFDRGTKSYAVQEVVRINHLSNCTMCHAVSTVGTDMVRGRIPDPNQPLPPPVQYYESGEGIFVRADVTYLKQDFSVVQPVERPGPWPKQQRFDYLVRTRPISEAEYRMLSKTDERTYPQRDALLYALKELEVDRRAPSEDVSLTIEKP